MPRTNLIKELTRTFDEINLKKENFSKNTYAFISDSDNNKVNQYTDKKWDELTEEAKNNFLLRALLYMSPHTPFKCLEELMNAETVPEIAMSILKRDNLTMPILDSMRHIISESEIENYLQIADDYAIRNNKTNIEPYISERTINLLLSDMINRHTVLYDGILLKYTTNESLVEKAMHEFEDDEKSNTQIANNANLPNSIRNKAFAQGYSLSMKSISLTDEMKEELYLGCADTYTEEQYIGDSSLTDARFDSSLGLKQLLQTSNMTGVAQYDLYERLVTMEEEHDNYSVFPALVSFTTENKVFGRLSENRRFLGEYNGNIYENKNTPQSFYRARANYLMNEIEHIRASGDDIFMIQKYKEELAHIINRTPLEKSIYNRVLALKDNALSIAVYASPNTPESIIVAQKKNLPPQVAIAKRFHIEALHSLFNKNQRLYNVALSSIAVSITAGEDFAYDKDFDVSPSVVISENNVYNKEVPPLYIKLINKVMTDTEKAFENNPEMSVEIMHTKNNLKLVTDSITASSIIGSQLNGFLMGQSPKETGNRIIVWREDSIDYNVDFEQLRKLDLKKCEKEIEQEWMNKTDSTSMYELRQKIEEYMSDLIEGLRIKEFVMQFENASRLYNLAQRIELKLDEKDLENIEKTDDLNTEER